MHENKKWVQSLSYRFCFHQCSPSIWAQTKSILKCGGKADPIWFFFVICLIFQTFGGYWSAGDKETFIPSRKPSSIFQKRILALHWDALMSCPKNKNSIWRQTYRSFIIADDIYILMISGLPCLQNEEFHPRQALAWADNWLQTFWNRC